MSTFKWTKETEKPVPSNYKEGFRYWDERDKKYYYFDFFEVKDRQDSRNTYKVEWMEEIRHVDYTDILRKHNPSNWQGVPGWVLNTFEEYSSINK